MKRALLAAASGAAILLLSCSDHRAKPEDSAPAPPKAPVSTFPGKPTAALIQRPEIAALVDDLAKEQTLESSHIGAGGTPSAVYAKFVAIQGKATEAELAALLEHQSPIVRGYVAQHIARAVPARLSALLPLSTDATGLATRYGCMGGVASVAGLVREGLCDSELPEAGGLLVTIARGGGREASLALACAAPTTPGPAAEIAAQALRGTVGPDDEAAYLRTLALAPTPDPNDGCALARPRVTSSDASVQIAAAQALWHCGDDASQKALLGLTGGKNSVVARHARASLFLAVAASREGMGGDRDVLFEVRDRLAQGLRSAEGTKVSLPLVEALALVYPETIGAPLYRAKVLPETTQAALRMAAKTEPGKFRGWAGARSDLLYYLARAKERSALPEFRRSLDSTEPREVAAALRGIEALGDKASRAAVEKLTTSTNREVEDAAKQALSAL